MHLVYMLNDVTAAPTFYIYPKTRKVLLNIFLDKKDNISFMQVCKYYLADGK